ncbi:MAG: hypothetical protein ACLFR1_05920 [Spirochaetia bacterium]
MNSEQFDKYSHSEDWLGAMNLTLANFNIIEDYERSEEQQTETEKPMQPFDMESVLDTLQFGETRQERQAARAKLVPGVDPSGLSFIILKCRKCKALFYENNSNLHLNWKLLNGGGSVQGGVIVHCPQCDYQAHVSQWYEDSCVFNKELYEV